MILLQLGVINAQVVPTFEVHTKGHLDKDVDIFS